MTVELGPFPLCDRCQETNGGLVATRHRQVHVGVAGKESCVDQGLVGVVATLWTVADTVSCCEDDGGRAAVVPTPETADAAERALTGLGLRIERTADGALRFALPARPAEAVPAEVPVDGDFVVGLNAADRALCEVARRLGRHTVGVEHPDIREARAALAEARRWTARGTIRQVSLIERPDGYLRPAGLAVRGVLSATACWLGAWGAHLVSGGSTAWTVVGGIAGLFAMVSPTARVLDVVDRRLGRLAVAWILSRRAETPAAGPAESTVLTPIQDALADVVMTIDSVRRAMATLHGRRMRAARHGPLAAAAFFTHQEFDFRLRAAAEADLALCLASDALVAWLQARRG
ncbi:hypothetical protein [Asanoa iriomotensis]|uniref:Uncharacterized protein n=1 Tax=Asanoa iriomotensis TaxID=234613 RepID=A0ABQ4BYI8_9ACTN|nr:hypothetical protein [Asanoa iriomotensis]GIF55598.1 hypothetical protein Air01nite_16930 [Asanoa iriomotensis]